MEIKGKIVEIYKTIERKNSFKTRDVVIKQEGEYPEYITIQFIQDKCEVLSSYKKNDDVVIGINIKGRMWEDPEGGTKYFNNIQGWRIKDISVSDEENITQQKPKVKSQVNPIAQEDDLPF